MSFIQSNKIITKTTSTWADIVNKGLVKKNTIKCVHCNTTDSVKEQYSVFSDNGILLCKKCYEKHDFPKNTIKCEYCDKTDCVEQYNSIFTNDGVLLCKKCYEAECCPICGIEAGGMCKQCKSEF